MGGGSVNFRILTLVRRTHALIIGNSLSNQEVHKETSMVRGGTLYITTPPEVSDPSSS